MIRSGLKLVLIFTLLITGSVYGQENAIKNGLDAITMEAVQGQLEFLASDWTRGRGTGDAGIYMAADYIASLFKVYGLKPGGDLETIRPSRDEMRMGVMPKQVRSYFQSFQLIEYSPGEDQFFSVISKKGTGSRTLNFVYRTDFSVNTSEVGIELNAPVVFVGYGLADKENKYDDYAGLDVEGKVILRLSGFPGHLDSSSAAFGKFHPEGPYSAYYLNREKNVIAESKGVAGIIEVTPGGTPYAGWADNIPFRYNSPFYEGDVPLRERYTRMRIPGDTLRTGTTTISVTMRVANEIVRGTGIRLNEFEEQVQRTMKPASRQLSGKSVYLKTTVNSRIVRDRNVLGVLEGENPDKIIVVGAHYDHMGEEKGYIWNGSDDNASGTVGVMTVAKACMAAGVKPKNTIVFAAWTAEEKGLLGSEYFVDNPFTPVGNILFNLNYDMISRNAPSDTSENQATLRYTEAYPELEEMTLIHIEEYGLDLEPIFIGMERPRGGSDFASFAAKDIPVLSFNAG
ncbi:MAG: M20/M25/M40 family metallo-hydrolase, partial [Bacteroidales bacterium]